MPLARLYLTGDLRAAAGISRTHMDYYLREGLVRPMAKTEGGYLLFDERELQTLRWIIAARAAGCSIREIRERLGR
jgi:DNA-binding transcriptional MerR regulator